MRNFTILVAITLAASASLFAQNPNQKLELPELHTIKKVTLAPSYGCRASDDSKTGYQNSALFLSAYAKQRNSPDLVFSGACRSDDYFQASTAGDDMSLIADLGTDVSLADVSASRAFNLKEVHSHTDYSKFALAVKVELNHIYAVLLNENDKRGLFVFKVTDYVPNQRVELIHAVKSYQVIANGRTSSESFSWTKGNY